MTANAGQKPNGTVLPSRRRRWARRCLVLAAAVLLCWIFHGAFLRAVAGFLVVDEPDETTDYVVPLAGDGRYAQAIRRSRAGQATHGILIFQMPPSRLERLGIMPTEEVVTRHELAKEGATGIDLELIQASERSDWARARALGDWLARHPDARVTMLCSRFGGKRVQQVFRSVLSPESVAHLRWRALPDRRYDETNWWHRREGALDVYHSFIGYLWVTWEGEDTAPWRTWNPDDYDRTLSQPP